MTDLRRTLRDIMRITDCMNRELCVRYCEWNVARAKASLSDALNARDRCRAAVAIAAHTEAPSIPQSLRSKA